MLGVSCFGYVVRLLRNGQKLALFVTISYLVAGRKGLVD